MRRQPHQQLALADALADQPELVVLQVAQPPVHELAALGARAARQVALVDHGHPQATAGGVQGHARSGGTHADDQYVELLGRRGGQLGGPRQNRESRVTHG
jgi:hypothetical protein